MTTRSGRAYKRLSMSDLEDATEVAPESTGDRGGASEEQGSSGGSPRRETSEMTTLIQMLIEDRRRREAEVAEDRERREREMEQRVEEMREQVETMRRLVESSGKSRSHTHPNEALVKVAKLTESDDIEGYLTTFERQMLAYEVEKTRWVFLLAPQLSGKAQQAYMAMDTGDTGDYEAVKKAILKRYDVSEESYRRKFRSRVKKKEESYSELATNLMDLCRKWLTECTTLSDVLEKLAIEQFVSTLPEEVRVWVREHKPATCAEAGQWADEYTQARAAPPSAPGKPAATKKPTETGPKKCYTCGQTGHVAWNCPSSSRSFKPSGASTGKPPLQYARGTGRRLYQCRCCWDVMCPTCLACLERGTKLIVIQLVAQT